MNCLFSRPTYNLYVVCVICYMEQPKVLRSIKFYLFLFDLIWFDYLKMCCLLFPWLIIGPWFHVGHFRLLRFLTSWLNQWIPWVHQLMGLCIDLIIWFLFQKQQSILNEWLCGMILVLKYKSLNVNTRCFSLSGQKGTN